METLSRRKMLTTAVVTISLPLLPSVLGHLRAADGLEAPTAPVGGTQTPGSGSSPSAAWFDTGITPADVKDKQLTAVKGHKVLLARQGDNLWALTSVCTHKGCSVAPRPGTDLGACPCHGAQFNLDGSVAKGPATRPLNHYAVRLNGKGTIEVDASQVVAKDAKDGILVSKAPAATQAA